MTKRFLIQGRKPGRSTDVRTAVLSQTAVYALRAMACLSALPEGEGARAKDLAQETGVPLAYLSKVLRKLATHGLLVAQKGHRGGFSLARHPREVRFLDILEALGEVPPSNRCAFGWGHCDASAPCPLHPAWAELDATFRSWAGSTTLANVLPVGAHGRARRDAMVKASRAK